MKSYNAKLSSAGYIISAIFTCWEYQRLGIHYRDYATFRASFWIKLGFIFIEAALALGFGVAEDREYYNSAAVCEWVAALIWGLYVWSFTIHFSPALIAKHHATDPEAASTTREQNGHSNVQVMDENESLNGNVAPSRGGYGSMGNGFANGRAANAYLNESRNAPPIEPTESTL